jgi:hypothetical protein
MAGSGEARKTSNRLGPAVCAGVGHTRAGVLVCRVRDVERGPAIAWIEGITGAERVCASVAGARLGVAEVWVDGGAEDGRHKRGTKDGEGKDRGQHRAYRKGLGCRRVRGGEWGVRVQKTMMAKVRCWAHYI